MTTHHTAVRHALVLSAVLTIAAGSLTTGACAGQGAAAGADPDAPVLVEVSDRFVVVQNRTGLPLVSVSVAIVPAKGTEFTKAVARIENLQRHQVAVSELRNREGASFNAMFSQPRLVRVVASDVTGRRYEAETAWR